ncbi:MAG: YfiR family protein [Deltaproteobacteria bacterium]|nr:YfiR family protein [Deltaproteobacteria bacterium]
MRASLILMAACIVLSVGTAAFADPDHRLEDRQARLLLRVLSYDAALPRWTKGRLRIGVLAGSPQREDPACARILSALQGLEGVTVQRLPVEVVALEAGPWESVAASVEKQDLSALYLCDSVAERGASIARMARARGLTVLAGDRELMRRGATLAVVVEGDRPKILLNLREADRLGHRFAVPLLRLAEIVEEDR